MSRSPTSVAPVCHRISAPSGGRSKDGVDQAGEPVAVDPDGDDDPADLATGLGLGPEPIEHRAAVVPVVAAPVVLAVTVDAGHLLEDPGRQRRALDPRRALDEVARHALGPGHRHERHRRQRPGAHHLVPLALLHDPERLAGDGDGRPHVVGHGLGDEDAVFAAQQALALGRVGRHPRHLVGDPDEARSEQVQLLQVPSGPGDHERSHGQVLPWGHPHRVPAQGHIWPDAYGTGLDHDADVALGRVETPSEQAVYERARDQAGTRPRPGPPPTARVALVHLGNSGGLGTTRRVGVWQDLLAAAGAQVFEVNLLGDHRRLVPSPLITVPSLRGKVVPETATWSARGAERAIRQIAPDVVLFVTPRAFHPRLAGLADRAVLDFQDRFSYSYRGRALVDRRPGAATAWRALGWAVARFERRDHRIRTVAAGWSEAHSIGATWIPNVVSTVPSSAISDHADAPFDVLFFGKLSSLPNVDAMRRLGELWPRLRTEVPGIRCLVAGNDLNDEVHELAAVHGWTAEGDFADFAQLCRRARLAVVPLRHANGIQNKVLEAAGAGLPQVVSPQALGGTAPGFPAMVARTSEGMVTAVRLLLNDPRRRLELAVNAHSHVGANYSVERWTPTVAELLGA